MAVRSLKSMKNKIHAFFLLLLISAFLLGGLAEKSVASDSQGNSLTAKMKQFPKDVIAGDALLITLTLKEEVKNVIGTLYGNPVFFFKDDEDDKIYYAFVGTDINQKEDNAFLSFKVIYESGIGMSYRYEITVKKVVHPEEKLTVAKKMVEPPKEESERIKEEREAVLDVYSHPNKKKMYDSSFILPLNSEMSSFFGKRRVYNGIKKPPHNGVDLRGAIGTKIKSSNSGKVVLARDLYFTGNTVIIDHGLGLFTAYFHLNKIYKKEGSDIKKGENIGTVGMTGRVTGPHLHFGVKLNGLYINPLSLISLTEKIYKKDDVSARN